MIGPAIYAHLSTDVAVSALVSDRIYPQKAREGATYPLVLYSQVSSGQEEARCMAGPAEHFRTLQQIDIYGHTQASVAAIAKAVRAAFDNKIKQTWGGLSIASSTFDEQFDSGFEPDSNLHRIIQQYRIVLTE